MSCTRTARVFNEVSGQSPARMMGTVLSFWNKPSLLGNMEDIGEYKWCATRYVHITLVKTDPSFTSGSCELRQNTRYTIRESP